jgi:hypothetical protein
MSDGILDNRQDEVPHHLQQQHAASSQELDTQTGWNNWQLPAPDYVRALSL